MGREADVAKEAAAETQLYQNNRLAAFLSHLHTQTCVTDITYITMFINNQQMPDFSSLLF
jgi:hypothetical protein